MQQDSMPANTLRTALLSDIHLGSPHCHAAELARFLSRLRCERSYLVGDIVDFWWSASHRVSPRLPDGLVHANDGDWVESLTALVEDVDGGLRPLAHTHDTVARISPRRVPVLAASSMERAA